MVWLIVWEIVELIVVASTVEVMVGLIVIETVWLVVVAMVGLNVEDTVWLIGWETVGLVYEVMVWLVVGLTTGSILWVIAWSILSATVGIAVVTTAVGSIVCDKVGDEVVIRIAVEDSVELIVGVIVHLKKVTTAQVNPIQLYNLKNYHDFEKQ